MPPVASRVTSRHAEGMTCRRIAGRLHGHGNAPAAVRVGERPGGGWGRGLVLATTLLLVPVHAHAQAPLCEPERASGNYPSYASRTVRIGSNPTYPPFTYAEPGDPAKMGGLDVDIVEHAMKCAGLKFEYVRGQTSGLYPALFAGTLDVMLGNIFIRPDRVDKASFVLYMINGQSVVVRTGNPKGIVSSEAMCGKVATGLYVGTSAMIVKGIGERCIAAGKPPVDYAAASDQEQAYRSLANGRADLVMDGAGSAAERVKSQGQGFEIAFTLQTDIKSGIIVPKGNEEMLAAIGNGLKDLEASGGLGALMIKHGLQARWLIPIEIHP